MSATSKSGDTEGFAPSTVGRCGSCRYWQLSPTQVMPKIPGGDEMICGKSRLAGYGLHGQDGRAIITPPEFGCILYSANAQGQMPREAGLSRPPC